MVLPVALLVSACLLVGIFPSVTAGPFLATAAHAVLGSDIPAYSLNVWHGITIPLLMSVTALIGGVLLYLVLRTYLSSGIEGRSEEHTSELQSLMRISYAVFCLKKQTN